MECSENIQLNIIIFCWNSNYEFSPVKLHRIFNEILNNLFHIWKQFDKLEMRKWLNIILNIGTWSKQMNKCNWTILKSWACQKTLLQRMNVIINGMIWLWMAHWRIAPNKKMSEKQKQNINRFGHARGIRFESYSEI